MVARGQKIGGNVRNKDACADHQRSLGVKMHIEINFEKISFEPTSSQHS